MDITATADILRLSSDADVQQQMDLLAMMMQMDHHHYNSTFHIDPSPQIDQFSSNITTPSPLMYNYSPTTNNVAQSSSSSPIFIDPISDMPSYTYPSDQKMRTCSFSDMATMREMIFRIAVMQPVHIDPESVKPPKRRNVKISKDPQSVAARHRRERISERIRILQRLVPGGTKMDTASMLDEAIHYVKFLKKQVRSLERVGANRAATGSFPTTMANVNLLKGSCQPPPPSHMVVGAVLQQQVLN